MYSLAFCKILLSQRAIQYFIFVITSSSIFFGVNNSLKNKTCSCVSCEQVFKQLQHVLLLPFLQVLH